MKNLLVANSCLNLNKIIILKRCDNLHGINNVKTYTLNLVQFDRINYLKINKPNLSVEPN